MTSIDLGAARSFLFVPGDRPERFDKAVATGADVVIIDLEDAVAPAAKEAARTNAAAWLGAGGHAMVRVNGIGTPWHDADLRAVGQLAIGVMVPKSESADALADLGRRLGDTKIVALIESVRGVRELHEICAAHGVARVALGNADLSAELGVDAGSHAALALVRATLVLASAGAGLPAPIDGITTAFDSPETLQKDLDHAGEIGFSAKLCIHPRQVATVNVAFVPSASALAWARQVVSSVDSSGGVAAVGGAMIDAPVIRRAEQIIARSAAHLDH